MIEDRSRGHGGQSRFRSRRNALRRLQEDSLSPGQLKRWGPYPSGCQWATVREDYCRTATVGPIFPTTIPRSRAYRWGEDGLLGSRTASAVCASLCGTRATRFLKERLFGLTGPRGNHGEDVKECYYISIPRRLHAGQTSAESLLYEQAMLKRTRRAAGRNRNTS